MKHEYEAKFLAVDVAGLQAKLAALGAARTFPRTLLTRKIFESDALDGTQWVRLRNEGTRTTLTLKQVTDASSIHGTTEIETEVSDLHATAEILNNLGLREVRYQENYREEWQLGDIAYDFDTWPDLPTFLEVEGPDEASVRQAAELLGLDYTEARFGSVDAIYKSEAGRDILAEPTLLFADVTEIDALSAPTPGRWSLERNRADGSLLAAPRDTRDRRVRPPRPARTGDDGRRQPVDRRLLPAVLRPAVDPRPVDRPGQRRRSASPDVRLRPVHPRTAGTGLAGHACRRRTPQP